MIEESTTIEAPAIELIFDDGVPLETYWHRLQMNLLIDVVFQAMIQRGRTDFFASGNNFFYFSVEQARFITTHSPDEYRHFCGPDFFFVSGVDGARHRQGWVVWEEGGRYPDVIIELLSPSTAKIDKTTKKVRYERIFRTPEYFWYDRYTRELAGWRLSGGRYKPIEPDEQGRLWSRELELALGFWQGEHEHMRSPDVWLRFYDAQGHLTPTGNEAAKQIAEAEKQKAETERLRAETEKQKAETERLRAEAEKQKAETERLRAETAEAEILRLRARIAESER